MFLASFIAREKDNKWDGSEKGNNHFLLSRQPKTSWKNKLAGKVTNNAVYTIVNLKNAGKLFLEPNFASR